MNTQKKARSLYWDIVKGWGIIAIVPVSYTHLTLPTICSV